MGKEDFYIVVIVPTGASLIGGLRNAHYDIPSAVREVRSADMISKMGL